MEQVTEEAALYLGATTCILVRARTGNIKIVQEDICSPHPREILETLIRSSKMGQTGLAL